MVWYKVLPPVANKAFRKSLLADRALKASSTKVRYSSESRLMGLPCQYSVWSRNHLRFLPFRLASTPTSRKTLFCSYTPSDFKPCSSASMETKSIPRKVKVYGVKFDKSPTGNLLVELMSIALPIKQSNLTYILRNVFLIFSSFYYLFYLPV